MTTFKVWIEIEEVNESGDQIADHSLALDGAAIAEFDTLDEAVEFGNRLGYAVERGDV